MSICRSTFYVTKLWFEMFARATRWVSAPEVYDNSWRVFYQLLHLCQVVDRVYSVVLCPAKEATSLTRIAHRSSLAGASATLARSAFVSLSVLVEVVHELLHFFVLFSLH